MGKTELSLSLVPEKFEIISADSVQVYRYLDIGSGKPEQEILAARKHHLIDIVDPDYPFSAGEYCRMAETACTEIFKKSRIPLFVGGTGLYIDSFFLGIASIPDIDISVRNEIYREMEEKGLEHLHGELLKHDPEFVKGVHPKDKQRIIRGLEVLRGTGRPLSSYYSENRGFQSEKTLFIGLNDDRDLIRKRIAARVGRMIESGLVDEVQNLRGRGYGPELKSMKSIGYAEINSFLDGLMPFNEAVDKIKINTAQYAKRQMTWFRKRDNIAWYRPEESKKIINHVQEWIDN